MQAVFFQFEFVVARNRGDFEVEDLRVGRRRGRLPQKSSLILDRDFERSVGPRPPEDAGEALANRLELIREHDCTCHWLSGFFLLK